MNKGLGDTIYRVGRDLLRKLGPEDRLVGAIKMGLAHDMNVDKILYALVCGFYFRAVDESGDMFEKDIEFVEKYFKKGIGHILANVCGFSKEKHRGIIWKCKEYSEEIKALINGAADWGKDQGQNILDGPMLFGGTSGSGILVEGYDHVVHAHQRGVADSVAGG